MNTYICTKCGKHCYSAASLEHLPDDKCPYCGGKIKPDTEKDQKHEEIPGRMPELI